MNTGKPDSGAARSRTSPVPLTPQLLAGYMPGQTPIIFCIVPSVCTEHYSNGGLLEKQHFKKHPNSFLTFGQIIPLNMCVVVPAAWKKSMVRFIFLGLAFVS